MTIQLRLAQEQYKQHNRICNYQQIKNIKNIIKRSFPIYNFRYNSCASFTNQPITDIVFVYIAFQITNSMFNCTETYINKIQMLACAQRELGGQNIFKCVDFFFMTNSLITHTFKVLSLYSDVVGIKTFNMNIIVLSLNKKDIIFLRRIMKIVFQN